MLAVVDIVAGLFFYIVTAMVAGGGSPSESEDACSRAFTAHEW
jgi:hypothetical protein